MKILHVIPGLQQASGPTSFCVNVCNQLADEKTSLTILYGGDFDETSCRPKNPRVRMISNGNFALLECCPDIVHVHALWAPLAHRGVQYARKHRIPYLISTHGMLAPWALKHKWLKKKIAWWLYQRKDLAHASLFHVTATSEIQWLRDLGFMQPCVLAPLGSDIPDIDPAGKSKRQSIKTVLFVGRIYPVKGLMNLVKAWTAVKARANGDQSSANSQTDAAARVSTHNAPLTISGAPWQLIVAGPDQAGHKSELVNEANRLGLNVADVGATDLINDACRVTDKLNNHHGAIRNAIPVSSTQSPVSVTPTIPPCLNSKIPDIIFTGPVYNQDKDMLYRIADLFVLPSFTENFGVVVTDALSYGIPVITTKGTPWEELRGSAVKSEVQSSMSSIMRKREKAKDSSAGQQNDLRTSELENCRNTSYRCGWWIDLGVEPLVLCLQEAMKLTDIERHQMGLNGRKLVEARYTWPAIAEQMRSAYRQWIICCPMTDYVHS